MKFVIYLKGTHEDLNCLFGIKSSYFGKLNFYRAEIKKP